MPRRLSEAVALLRGRTHWTVEPGRNEDEKLKPHSVYVIDDDRDVRRSLSFMLGAAEIRSHPFGSGLDFLDALPDLEPGCILLDLRMPQMDGFEVMEALVARKVDWPVIVMT